MISHLIMWYLFLGTNVVLYTTIRGIKEKGKICGEKNQRKSRKKRVKS